MTEINQREFGKTKLAIVSFFLWTMNVDEKKGLKTAQFWEKNLENQFLKKELT